MYNMDNKAVAFVDANGDLIPKVKLEPWTDLYTTPPAQPVQPAVAQDYFSWGVGEPPKWFKEWFIAKLDNGQRVVLKRLPEDFSYDYTTADDTYYAKRRIKKWMQFPDSEFVNLNQAPAVAVNEQMYQALLDAYLVLTLSDSSKSKNKAMAQKKVYKAIAAAEAAKGGV